MRVLVVPSWYPTETEPLNGSFFREQALMVAEAGHEVTVLVPQLMPATRWRGPSHTLEQDGPLTVLRVSVPALPRPLQRLEQELMGHLAARAHRSIAAEPPDVLHAHSVTPALLIAQDLAVRWGRPLVLTEHRPSSLSTPRSAARQAHLLHALADAEVVATVSAPFAEAIAAHYDITRPEVIPLPVPEAFFATDTLPGRETPYTFLHVSNLVRNKRTEETLEAFAAASSAVDARLIVAGGTPERAEQIRAHAEQLGIAEHVEVLGRVERERLPDLMSRCHSLVLASAVEAGGTVLGEARAAGLSVIATETWAGRAWVDAGSGALVGIDDPTALSGAMIRLAREGSGRERAQREAVRAAAQEIFSTEAFLERQIALYRRAIDRGAGPRMLFHAPFPIDPQPSSASRLRPLRMLEAFETLGYRVHPLTGAPRQRAVAHRTARRRVRAGQRFELLYSENSTQPNLLATSVRGGIAPLLEARILLWARRTGIPTGEFYRDVYWRFSTSLRSVRTPRAALMNLLYRLDLAVLRLSRTHLFLPSERMAPIVPVPPEHSSALPPGATVVDTDSPEGLHLLYVGGLGPEYGLDACVEAVSRTPEATLTLCVPEAQWEAHRARYAPHLGERIRVVHASGVQLEPLYAAASACVLFVEPGEYRTFAAPVKFFEYIGHGKPVLLSRGTYAGDLGESLGVGPVIEYSAEALRIELQDLHAHPGRLAQYADSARRVRHQQTWRARAEQAIARLRPRHG